MLAQFNINQALQASTIYSKSASNFLSSAIIKDAQGKNITIEWGNIESQVRAATTNQALSNMVSEPLGQRAIDHTEAETYELTNKVESDEEGEKVASHTADEQETQTENKQVIRIEIGKSSNKEDEIEANTQHNQVNKTDVPTLEEKTSNQVNSAAVGVTNQIEANQINSTVTNTNNNGSNSVASINNGTIGSQQNIKTYYGISTVEALKFQLNIGGKIEKNGQWVSATNSEIQKYFIPSEDNIEKYKYQFLNLASPAGISEAEARAYLSDKGILSGKEATFISAAKANNVNEIYLMAHACLETGNGTSKLAQGVNYNGTVVYNMFGINAVDSDPVGQGAAYAYKMGWTTPEKAFHSISEFSS